jgi:hypothetical protein
MKDAPQHKPNGHPGNTHESKVKVETEVSLGLSEILQAFFNTFARQEKFFRNQVSGILHHMGESEYV